METNCSKLRNSINKKQMKINYENEPNEVYPNHIGSLKTACPFYFGEEI